MQNQSVQENSDIRALALSQLKGNWLGPVLTTLVYFIISSIISSIPIPGTSIGPFDISGTPIPSIALPVLSVLVSGAFSIGLCLYFMNVARRNNPELANIFAGFNQFIQALIAGVLVSIITFLGTLLFLIPGIIAGLGLSQTYYIMADEPGISAIDAMKQSWEMTKGYKVKILLLGLSFIPWFFLSIFTLFIGFLWLMPYMYTSFANLYLQMRGDKPSLEIQDHLVI